MLGLRFAQQNMIWEIDGLEGVEELDTLNLSNNNISCLQRLSHLTKLRTLLITNNRLASVEAVKHVAECQALAVLDLSNNRYLLHSPFWRT
jgi:dynein assembly factor 1